MHNPTLPIALIILALLLLGFFGTREVLQRKAARDAARAAEAQTLPEGAIAFAKDVVSAVRRQGNRKVAFVLTGTYALKAGIACLQALERSGNLAAVSAVIATDFSIDVRDWFLANLPSGIASRTEVCTSSAWRGGFTGLSASEVLAPNVRKWWWDALSKAILAGGSLMRAGQPRVLSPMRPILRQGDAPSVVFSFVSSGGHFGVGITATALIHQLFPKAKVYAISLVPELPPLRGDQFAEGLELLAGSGVPKWVLLSDEWKGQERCDRAVADFIAGVCGSDIDVDNPLRWLGNGIVVLRSATQLLPVLLTDAPNPTYFTYREAVINAVNDALEAAEDECSKTIDLPTPAHNTVRYYIVTLPLVPEFLTSVRSQVEQMLRDAGWYSDRSRKLLWHATSTPLSESTTDAPISVVVAEAAIGNHENAIHLLRQVA